MHVRAFGRSVSASSVSPPGRRRAWASRPLLLYAIAAGGAAAEVAGIKAAGMVSSLPLAAQATAVTPVVAFHDVRWLLVYATGWGPLVGELAAAVALRSAMMTFFIEAAWPSGPRPSWRPLLARTALAYFLVVVAMSPWGILSFASAVGAISFPLIAGIFFAALVGIFVVPHAGVSPRWWTRWPSWGAIGWSALDFASVTVWAIVIDYSPGWVVLVSAAGAGLVNARCWQGLVRACARQPVATPSRRRLVGVPASFTAIVCGLAVLAASGVALLGAPATLVRHAPQPPPRRGQQVVLVVNGLDSAFDGGPPGRSFPGYYTATFSYQGLGPRGHPLPYDKSATTAGFRALTHRFAVQVDRLAARSRRKVDVVAVSEGTLVVEDYLAHHHGAPVRTVVLSSPLPRPDRVYYPTAKDMSGFGAIAGAEARLLLEVPETEVRREDIRATIPMLGSLLRNGPFFRQRSLCPAPHARVVAVLPLSAAVVDPPGPVAGIPNGVVPTIHAELETKSAVRTETAKVLAGEPLDHFFGWGLTFQFVRYSASAWETPSLPLSLVPTWRRHGGTHEGDAAFGTYGCRAADHPSGTIGTKGSATSATRADR